MLKRREAELAAEASATPKPGAPPRARVAGGQPDRGRAYPACGGADQREGQSPSAALRANEPRAPVLPDSRAVPVLHEAVAVRPPPAAAAPGVPGPPRGPPGDGAGCPARPARRARGRARRAEEMMGELRSMRGLIEQRFGALAFMEKLQRQPRQAQLSQRLLDAASRRRSSASWSRACRPDVDEMAWAAGVLERNLATGERETALEDAGGVFALIGATGVGKTTSTAKLAAAFAARHGAANLGLVTLDAYRVGAHEQLRTYGRILGVPVHTAHDRASLEDLLDLLSGKRMVLIDTAGMAQRDSRTRELLEMLSHRAIQRLLVVNAAAQGETIEDQIAAYAAASCRGVVLSKIDEAVKLGPALDAMIRHRSRCWPWPTASACPKTGTACRPTRWCSARCAAAAARPGSSTRRRQPHLRRPARRPVAPAAAP
jgi:flagellar biosynthesis protein FlhF